MTTSNSFSFLCSLFALVLTLTRARDLARARDPALALRIIRFLLTLTPISFLWETGTMARDFQIDALVQMCGKHAHCLVKSDLKRGRFIKVNDEIMAVQSAGICVYNCVYFYGVFTKIVCV